MESPSDKCEGFEKNKTIETSYFHTRAQSVTASPQHTKVEVITIRPQSNVRSGNYKHKSGILNCLSSLSHTEHHNI